MENTLIWIDLKEALPQLQDGKSYYCEYNDYFRNNELVFTKHTGKKLKLTTPINCKVLLPQDQSELISKIHAVKLCLMAHPDNEEDSEFADRISDLEEIESSLTN